MVVMVRIQRSHDVSMCQIADRGFLGAGCRVPGAGCRPRAFFLLPFGMKKLVGRLSHGLTAQSPQIQNGLPFVTAWTNFCTCTWIQRNVGPSEKCILSGRDV
eukprot:scaffold21513_cov56-Cyclotella_meneghiniana.AAC.3